MPPRSYRAIFRKEFSEARRDTARNHAVLRTESRINRVYWVETRRVSYLQPEGATSAVYKWRGPGKQKTPSASSALCRTLFVTHTIRKLQRV